MMNIYTKEKSTNKILKLSFNKLNKTYSWSDISQLYGLAKRKYKSKVSAISFLALSEFDFADIEVFENIEEAKKYFESMDGL